MKSRKPIPPLEIEPTGNSRTGIDELNLAEFPLATLSERQPANGKTIVYEERLFDRKERRTVTRQLVISGCDHYGLPTAKDEEILLACIQITKKQGFKTREVSFSRYEIVKLLGMPNDTRSYNRIELSLRRWKGVSIFSDRAFYDRQAKSWINRDFGVIDNLDLYRRKGAELQSCKRRSRMVWNEVLFDSFRAGYLKKIDWELYCSLKSPIAKRLYRFLDKRFHLKKELTIDVTVHGSWENHF